MERELGRGGMGRVLLAFDTKLRGHVAVKLVPDNIVADAEAAEDLRREVLRGMALTHPGIVRAHTFEHDASGAAIVMEYVDGLTFTEWKGQQPGRCFETEQLLPWLEPLCEVLEHAHRGARIVHRDLKPRNIMVRRGSIGAHARASTTPFATSSFHLRNCFACSPRGQE
ncbi:MAG: protein kinase [Chthoniobacteraceae bacterium]